MAVKRKSLFDVPVHAVLISMYPGLSLLSTNIHEVSPIHAIRPLAVSIALAGAIAMVSHHFLQNWTRAFMSAGVTTIVFLSHGHLVRVAGERFEGSPETIGGLVTGASVLLLAASLYGIWKIEAGVSNWNAGLNLAAVVLVLPPLYNLSLVTLAAKPGAGQTSVQSSRLAATDLRNNVDGAEPLPDIYYILLDGYSRADTLETLGYDNSPFLNTLRGIGFHVAECSRSNYRSTLLSMPSIFNMEYLHDFLPQPPGGESTIPLLSDLLVHNRVRAKLEQLGYTIISFETGYRWNEWTDADHYLSPGKRNILEMLISPSLTEFEYVFLQNTALAGYIENSKIGTTRYNDLQTRVNFTFDELPETANLPGPKFVYAHVLTPHYPFIFLPDGSLNTDSRYFTTERGTPEDPELSRIGYINNVQYVNSRLPDILRSILGRSVHPPVIIIQGDHGHVLPERRFNNLSAFYLPGGGEELLYPEITSVNTFRLVFNKYFGGTFELLEDVSLDADIGNPYLESEAKPFPESCPD